MNAPATAPLRGPFRYVGKKRRVREDRRFATGDGHYAADVALPGMLHAVPLQSEYPAARIVAIDASAALALPGVRAVLTGAELAAAIEPLMNGAHAPLVRRYPLAVGQVRYAGEWVAVVVAESRAIAEDARELIAVEYAPLPFVLDGEAALDPASPPVHPDHGSNVLLDRHFVWGEVDAAFAAAPRRLAYRVVWGRSSTVPLETFGVTARWDHGLELLDVWASIQMPKFPDQIARALRLPGNAVRVHHDIDVGGSYGVKRGIKHAVLVGHLARLLDAPVRLLEDRLENMTGGDMQGPERIFDVQLAFEEDGRVRAMRMRALDNVGAYAGRSPFQLGKPIGAIVGPYAIGAVAYHALAVTSNKTPQEAVRGFGQAPTNYALETGIDRVAEALGLDRLEVRRRNFIRAEQFPYTIPSGTTYDSGDYHALLGKAVAAAEAAGIFAERDRLRAAGMLAGIGVATVLEPSGGNSSFEPLLNPHNRTTTWMDSCRVTVDATGAVTATLHTTSAGQAHETLVAVAVAEVLEIDPERIRVVRPDSLGSLPSNSPVGSRMAIMLGGAAVEAARRLKAQLMAIAAHDLGVAEGALAYEGGRVAAPDRRALDWAELVQIAHREFFRLPPGSEPGLAASAIYQVPTGGQLPTADGRVHMYPCHSAECHLVLVAIDPVLGKPEIRRWITGHDCGTVISPDVVRGMTLGGIAHGIGAALLEEFTYDRETGQPTAASFMDYPMPSAHEVPEVEIVHQCTPSPLTVFGQKGSGESGYLGGPAALASAVNDALRPLGLHIDRLPMRPAAISDAIADTTTQETA
ncbi:xanthine dehydrogenase family protein molybdopterin-binding subunit [Roseomonas sp. E05]|uniref:xanthine dehydrogenase family protein molybdopterin-binding subunit n=1 Tax=Roseomonas sp. E05 TaxID=3046310 RepID=UPI0024B9EFB2|nr:xanthine dehydrogenase family protein molybdopterin-binding subunit [Roseomonas sp. E05]MDJ0391113.1 xanthine dehydrogenase family protein molybdopterin-binding subunit [Roseomonas sp. E05]